MNPRSAAENPEPLALGGSENPRYGGKSPDLAALLHLV